MQEGNGNKNFKAKIVCNALMILRMKAFESIVRIGEIS